MWKMIYENDADGSRTGGDLDSLKNAVVEGRPLRVLLTHGAGTAHALDCGPTRIEGGYVFAQISFAPSEWDANDPGILRFSNGTAVWMMNVSTSGRTHARQITAGAAAIRQEDTTYAIRWFAQE